MRLPSLAELVDGVARADRPLLARAITLVESSRPDHRPLADALLEALMPHTGRSWRVGITGVPGAGKSSFIEALGLRLLGSGRRVGVLAVDPSSVRTGGSVLGDKTRMTRLGQSPGAFIRPSPTNGSLGGVARRTREALLLLEAAGFDVVLVETVGVGQSEVVVHEMVDTFLWLALTGAGDDLQGIKRGIVEMADLVVVHKADGANLPAAERAAHELRGALHTLHGKRGQIPQVLCASAHSGLGLAEVWEAVGAHRAASLASGAWQARRERQRGRWMWQVLEAESIRALQERLARLPELGLLEAQVQRGQIPPTVAASRLLAALAAAPHAGVRTS